MPRAKMGDYQAINTIVTRYLEREDEASAKEWQDKMKPGGVFFVDDSAAKEAMPLAKAGDVESVRKMVRWYVQMNDYTNAGIWQKQLIQLDPIGR